MRSPEGSDRPGGVFYPADPEDYNPDGTNLNDSINYIKDEWDEKLRRTH